MNILRQTSLSVASSHSITQESEKKDESERKIKKEKIKAASKESKEKRK